MRDFPESQEDDGSAKSRTPEQRFGAGTTSRKNRFPQFSEFLGGLSHGRIYKNVFYRQKNPFFLSRAVLSKGKAGDLPYQVRRFANDHFAAFCEIDLAAKRAHNFQPQPRR